MLPKPLEIITDLPIKVKAGETFEIRFKSPHPFCLSDSMATLKHPMQNGVLLVKISNADGHSIQNRFRVSPVAPVIISFQPTNAPGFEDMNSKDFYHMEITPDFDLDGAFSWGKGYPKEYLRLLQGQIID